MNRKEFLSLLLLCAATPKSLANYEDQDNPKRPSATSSEMNYILFSLYESPPRWLFDLPLKPTDKSKFKSSPMIGTEFIDEQVQYKTIQHHGFYLSSLLGNEIPTSNGPAVKMKEVLNNALVIRGCNMNKDGHDTNSKVLESSSEGQVSLGGQIASASQRPFKAIAVNGNHADLYKGVISSFKTPSGISATNCVDDQNYIKQILDLFKNDREVNSEETIKTFLSSLSEKLKTRDNFHYQKINKISKLPFEKIYKEFETLNAKYNKLIKAAHKSFKLKNITDTEIRGVKFPVTFQINEDKSTDPLDYLGAYQFLDHILTDDDLNNIFKEINYELLAQRFALIEISLKFKLTNVLIINIDPFDNLKISQAAPLNSITHNIDGDKITFSANKSMGFTSSKKKNLEFTNDAHYIGTLAALIGYSKIYHLFSTCLFELQSTLRSSGEFNKTLMHITSEFERSPQKNQAGSDHGWQGHTSTLISGKINNFNIIGSIKESSSNILKDHFCTWGEANYHPGLHREMRYGDIITTIADIFKVKSTEGGISLVKEDSKGNILPKFKEDI